MFSHPKNNLAQFDISPGMKVADFGSGAGYYTFLTGKLVGPTGRVYALDIKKNLLITLKREANKAHIFNIEIISADFENFQGTKLKNSFIERGIIANVLFQIHKREDFVAEVARVMRKDGKILVIDWTDSFGGIGPDPKDVITAEQCRSLFEKSGFVFEKKVTAGVHHYGFVFKKV